MYIQRTYLNTDLVKKLLMTISMGDDAPRVCVKRPFGWDVAIKMCFKKLMHYGRCQGMITLKFIRNYQCGKGDSKEPIDKHIFYFLCRLAKRKENFKRGQSKRRKERRRQDRTDRCQFVPWSEEREKNYFSSSSVYYN